MKKIGEDHESVYKTDQYQLDVDLDTDSVREVIDSFYRANDNLKNISFSNTADYSDHYSRTFPEYAYYESSGIEADADIERVSFACVNDKNPYNVAIDLGFNTVDILFITRELKVDVTPILIEAEENIKKKFVQ